MPTRRHAMVERASAWRGGLVALALLGACGGGEPEEAPTRRVGRGGAIAAPSPAVAPAPSSSSTRSSARRPAAPPAEDDSWRTVGRPAEPAAVEAAAPAPEAEVAPVERDLSAELSAAYGSPTSCFDFARISTFGDTLRVNVSVTVMPSGRVNRATASGTGLNDAEVECLEARAMALNLRGPIEGAPRTISTRIEYAIETRPAPTE